MVYTITSINKNGIEHGTTYTDLVEARADYTDRVNKGTYIKVSFEKSIMKTTVLSKWERDKGYS